MLGYPETDKQHNDSIDLITDGCRELKLVEQDDHTFKWELILNPRKVWYKSNLVNSPTFGRFALELEKFLNLATQAYNNMSKECADVLSKQIQDIAAAYMYSIDAKSSEMLRDKNNSQSTLVHILQHHKMEKAITLKGQVEKTLWDSIIGKEKRDEVVN